MNIFSELATQEFITPGIDALYGRRWRVLVQHETEKALDVSDLRCTFRVSKVNTGQASTAEICIYNLNAASEAKLIEAGFYVTVEAGYAGQYGVVFSGDIIQVFRNREEGLNYKLHIIAVDGSKFLGLNYVRTTLAAGSSPRDVAQSVASESTVPIEVEEISENVGDVKLPRPKVLFGAPKDYLEDLSKGNSSFYWIENNKLILRKYTDEVPEKSCVELTPTSGLVGTPRYTDQGIHIVSLLNPRLVLGGLVKIDNELVSRSAVALPERGHMSTGSQQAQFDVDGEYQIYSLVINADTHGPNWTTEIVGISRNGRTGLPTMVADSSKNVRS